MVNMQPTQAFQQHPVLIQAPASQASTARMDQALGVKTTKCLAIMLMVTGLLMTALQIICIIILREAELYSAHLVGSGIWCGIIVFISGVIGLQLARKKTNALAVTFLVFNILGVLIFAPITIGTTGGDLNSHRDFCRYVWDEDNKRQQDCSFSSAIKALTSLLLADAVLVFFLSIWGIVTNSTAIEKAKACACCCRCCEDPAPQTQAPIIIYMPANQMPTAAADQPTQLYAFPNPSAFPAPNPAPEIAGGAFPRTGSIPPPYKA